MENNYNTDDFLAKWASGAITDAEKEAFKNTEEYKYYQVILEGTDALEVPVFNKEQLFAGVQEKIQQEPKVIRIMPKWAYAIAASVALLIGFVFFFNNATSFETGFGEQLAITLPDNSEVILNAKSELEYDESDWEVQNRQVSLKGEAFFTVEKGSSFSVATHNGIVTVLGTQFTVNAVDDTFEVVCYEGKVKVENDADTKIITKGQAVRWSTTVFEDFQVMDITPSWLQEESSFVNAPLLQVIKALENEYKVSIDQSAIDASIRFTGSFTHTKLETALRTVFESVDINFTFEAKSHIVLSKK